MYKTNNMFLKKFFFLVLTTGILLSCKDKKAVTVKNTEPGIVVRKDTANLKKEVQPSRPPIINIVDTVSVKYIVVYVKDTAASSQRISEKLAAIYGSKLPAFIAKNNLKIIGPPIAWYKSNKSPFIFEAGFPVDKKPAKVSKGILVKNIGGDSAVMAHFYGPYSSTFMAYEALTDWLKDNKKKTSGLPYEIYVTDPVGKDGKLIDPYKVQTDIVFPHR
jgi:effector-binding domain-containing protein